MASYTLRHPNKKVTEFFPLSFIVGRAILPSRKEDSVPSDHCTGPVVACDVALFSLAKNVFLLTQEY